jgi:hypothetical protein
MLKIKDNVDLKELEKFGYKLGQDTTYVSYGNYGKIFKLFYKQLDKYKDIEDIVFIIEISESRDISLKVTTKTSPRVFKYVDKDIIKPYIQDLIQADLVEKR